MGKTTKTALVTLVFILLASIIAIADDKIIPTTESWDKELSLDSIEKTRIKEVANVDNIELDISEINCSCGECWASIYQEGVINTDWRRAQFYCIEYEEIRDENKNIINITCTKETEYTQEENKKAIQEYAEKNLKQWSKVEEKRQNRIITKKSEKGRISEEKTNIQIKD